MHTNKYGSKQSKQSEQTKHSEQHVTRRKRRPIRPIASVLLAFILIITAIVVPGMAFAADIENNPAAAAPAAAESTTTTDPSQEDSPSGSPTSDPESEPQEPSLLPDPEDDSDTDEDLASLGLDLDGPDPSDSLAPLALEDELEPFDSWNPTTRVLEVTISGVSPAGRLSTVVPAALGGTSPSAVEVLRILGTGYTLTGSGTAPTYYINDRQYIRDELTSLIELDMSGYTGTFPAGTAPALPASANGPFSGCTTIQKVRLNSVSASAIQIGMFAGCTSLTTLAIGPEGTMPYIPGVINITGYSSSAAPGTAAFEGCTSITTVRWRADIWLSERLFRNCTNLTTLSLGPGEPLRPGAIDLYAEGPGHATNPSYSGRPPLTTPHYGINLFDGCTGITTVWLASTNNMSANMFANGRLGTEAIAFVFPSTSAIPALVSGNPFTGGSTTAVNRIAYVGDLPTYTTGAMTTAFPPLFNSVKGISPPAFTGPTNQFIDPLVASTASFTATPSGALPIELQWQVLSTAPASVWTDIPSSTSATLTLPADPSMDGFKFRCIAKNMFGSTTSDEASLRFLYKATLSIYKNNTSWRAPFPATWDSTINKTFTLRLTTESSGGIPGTEYVPDGTVTFPAPGQNLTPGTYDILDGDNKTGKTITITDSSVTARLDYYDVTHTVTSIRAHGSTFRGNNTITGATGLVSPPTLTTSLGSQTQTTSTVVLGGGSLVFTATGNGAADYEYAFSGSPAATTVSNNLATFNPVNQQINILCTITGTSTITQRNLVLTAPVPGATPASTITPTVERAGTVTWFVDGLAMPTPTFDFDTKYEARIVIQPSEEYTCVGVPTAPAAGTFTVPSTNPDLTTTITYTTGSTLVRVFYTRTGPRPVNIAAIPIPMPAAGNPRPSPTPSAPIAGPGYDITNIAWSPSHATFQPGETYVATLTLLPNRVGDAVGNYTFWSVPTGFFSHTGAIPSGVEYIPNPGLTNMDPSRLPATVKITFIMTPDPAIDILTIAGVTAPVSGATPVTTVTETTQYTGAVTWSPALVDGKFDFGTEYTATIKLYPKLGRSTNGIGEDTFTVTGAVTTTNPAYSSAESYAEITATFAATGKEAIAFTSPVPIPPPVGGALAPTTITTDQYIGTIVWTPTSPAGPALASGDSFGYNVQYSAALVLSPNPATEPPDRYTFAGYTGTPTIANGVTVSGVTYSPIPGTLSFSTGSFPATGSRPIDNPVINLPVPEKETTPVYTIPSNGQFSATVAWYPTPTGTVPAAGSFDYKTVYTAVVTIIPVSGYTVTGVEDDFFTISGASPGGISYIAGDNTVTVTFPRTEPLGVYAVTEVDNTAHWTGPASGDVTFSIDYADHTKLADIYQIAANDIPLPGGPLLVATYNYLPPSSGSTIVTFLQGYVNSFSNGKYTFYADFTTGGESEPFYLYINRPPKKPGAIGGIGESWNDDGTNPKTSDPGVRPWWHSMLWTLILADIALLLFFLAVAKRRHTRMSLRGSIINHDVIARKAPFA